MGVALTAGLVRDPREDAALALGLAGGLLRGRDAASGGALASGDGLLHGGSLLHRGGRLLHWGGRRLLRRRAAAALEHGRRGGPDGHHARGHRGRDKGARPAGHGRPVRRSEPSRNSADRGAGETRALELRGAGSRWGAQG